MTQISKKTIRYVLTTCNFRRGQTLIEVIIAIGLIVLVFTTLAAGVALSVRNSRFARNQALSKEYAREGIEMLRSMRDQMGWDAFAAAIRADGSPVTYCVDTIKRTPQEFVNLMASGSCTTPVAPNYPFVRTIRLTTSGTPINQVDARVFVTWTDGGKTFTSESTLILRKWQ